MIHTRRCVAFGAAIDPFSRLREYGVNTANDERAAIAYTVAALQSAGYLRERHSIERYQQMRGRN